MMYGQLAMRATNDGGRLEVNILFCFVLWRPLMNRCTYETNVVWCSEITWSYIPTGFVGIFILCGKFYKYVNSTTFCGYIETNAGIL
jgi:hypothetical protein